EVTLPFRLLNNHIFIDVMVDGKGPFPFFVDTGGHDILTPSPASALGLKPEGATISGGAGEKTQLSGYTKVHTLRMGAATMSDQTVLILDMSPIAVEGFQPGGMIGFEMLQRFVVRIDYGASTLTLIDPARFDPQVAGTPVPFKFYEHMPQVTGHFAGIPARFNIDTGSRAGVTLATPYVRAHRLRERAQQSVIATDGWGVGGPSRSQVMRASSLEMGGITVPDVVAGLNLQHKGVYSDANFDGNVGSGFLKRFVVTFDYGHQVMYLKSLAHSGADTGSFDRSGMWINLGSDGYDVMDVASDSPAAEAGLTVADVITHFDGRGTDELSLADARKLLRVTPAGTQMTLTVRRGVTTRKVKLVLRDLIPADAPPLGPRVSQAEAPGPFTADGHDAATLKTEVAASHA
ncbi:MAG: aspartyl protease family protein, partial [Rhodanobacter sp.]